MPKTQRKFLIALILFAIGLVATVWFNTTDKREPAENLNSLTSVDRIAHELEVGVIGKKFKWIFRYPGVDGQLGTVDDVESDRQLVLPPGHRIKFHVQSDDYVYILGIPQNEKGSLSVMSGELPKIRELAVPGLVRHLDHSFVNPGTYDLIVDPLCGFQSIHDPLMGQIFVSDKYNFSTLYPRSERYQDPL